MTAVTLFARLPDFVELLIPRVNGVAQWRVTFATNFDTVFTPFQDVPRSGFRSLSVKRFAVSGESTKTYHRFAYDPADYVGVGYPADSRFVWLQLIPISPTGAVGAAERERFLLPAPSASAVERRVASIRGTAPNVAAPAIGNPPPGGSYHLRLPEVATAARIVNEDAAVNLAVAFDGSFSEMLVGPSAIDGVFFTPGEGYFRDMFVRGDGGAVIFSATFDLVGIKA